MAEGTTLATCSRSPPLGYIFQEACTGCAFWRRSKSDAHTDGSCARAQEAMEVFKFYLYQDRLDARLDAESAAAVLHIAQYYGAPRLAGLCEHLLAREIRRRDPEDEGVTQNPQVGT